VGIGAKDQSKHIVAGLHRNFTQDSCNLNKKRYNEKDQGLISFIR